ncbi:hypothetical protein [Motiliproteus sp.]|uniref:hypothetical protein n=1 Tax=Motiliproteus sp. TaxID=1898955 RepID=UPI003BAC26EE
MAYALQFDGVNDYVDIDVPLAHSEGSGYDAEFEIVFKATDATSWLRPTSMVKSGSYADRILANQDSKTFRVYRGTSYVYWTLTGLDFTEFHRFTIRVLPGTGKLIELLVDGVSQGTKTQSSAGLGNFGVLGASSGVYSALQIQYAKFTDSLDSANDRFYDARSTSSGSLLPETTANAGDAPLIGFPTDDIQWVDIGGGGGSPDPITTLPTAVTISPTTALIHRINQVAVQSSAVGVSPGAALINRANPISANIAAVTVSPTDAQIDRVNTVTAQPSAVVASAQAAVINRVNQITSQPTAVAITPQNALITQGRLVVAIPATVAISPTDTQIDRINQITAVPTAVNVSPQNALISQGRLITLLPTAVAVAPIAALIDRVNQITAIPTLVAVATTDALLVPSHALAVLPASVTVSPTDAQIDRVNRIQLLPASIAITPTPTTVGQPTIQRRRILTGARISEPGGVVGRWSNPGTTIKLRFQ